MRILLAGAGGQLGRCIQDAIDPNRHQLIALDRSALNVADGTAVARAVSRLEPDVVINAAAFTQVDKAQAEPEMAALINIQGAANLAAASQLCGALMIQPSSDYVYDGAKAAPYYEDDATGPINVYGFTKLRGEEEVRRRCERHVILRTSWLFSKYGQNFVATVLQLAREKGVLQVVDDQIGCPTFGPDLAAACLALCDAQSMGQVTYGVFHFAGDGHVSRYQFAGEICDAAFQQGMLLGQTEIRPITSNQWQAAAPRPLNSRLGVAKFEDCFGPVPRNWRQGLDQLIRSGMR
ncbi:dTDP-4-dehydrorhamnose reductase [Spongiibacter taiwanensis]|uniref:dTDP-4-dehydrorhamnose reductase n=1 Tax=Spongiibacter taiwanensis TaxID=1748242 RepID=UPI002035C208|nr:dTDP-4-dehydrorhamnose reductase [Spongiibacter taiwanensis]USA44573.1 dTDP-4-dehydrorhamnose reductase [Spongiibacter taiwanensis]